MFMEFLCVCVCVVYLTFGFQIFTFVKEDTKIHLCTYFNINYMAPTTVLTRKWLLIGLEQLCKHFTEICPQVRSGVPLPSGGETNSARPSFHLVTTDAGQGQGHRVHKSRWRLDYCLAAAASHVLSGGQPAVLLTGNGPEQYLPFGDHLKSLCQPFQKWQLCNCHYHLSNDWFVCVCDFQNFNRYNLTHLMRITIISFWWNCLVNPWLFYVHLFVYRWIWWNLSVDVFVYRWSWWNLSVEVFVFRWWYGLTHIYRWIWWKSQCIHFVYCCMWQVSMYMFAYKLMWRSV